MNKILLQFKLIFIVLLFNCYGKNPVLKVPDYYLNPPKDSDGYFGAGSGKSMDEAKINALGEILRSLKSELSFKTSSPEMMEEAFFDTLGDFSQSKSKVRCKIGKIDYDHVLLDQILINDDIQRNSVTEKTSMTTKINFDKGQISIHLFLSVNGLGEEVNRFTKDPKDADLNIVFQELEKNGFKFLKDEKIGGLYFSLLSLKTSNKFKILFTSTPKSNGH